MDTNTLRIFCFPGGGSKGYGANRILQKFIQQWGIPQADLWKYADIMCGTSIGGISTCFYSFGKTPDELESLFLEDAKRIFTIRTVLEYAASSHNANSNSNRPNIIQKVALIGNNTPFYQSPYPDSNHGSNILHNLLTNTFGDSTLADLKTKVLIPAFQKNTSKFVVFSNFNDPKYFYPSNTKIVDVCRATSAAPIYLPHYTFGGNDYIDGGIYANDPILMAINVGLTIKPHAKRIVIVDFGTGIGSTSFDGSTPLTGSDHAAEVLFKIMNVAMTGAEEWSRYTLDYLSNRLLKNTYYYKFQPILSADFPNELDNSSPEWFAALASIVDTYYYKESAKISDILARLTL